MSILGETHCSSFLLKALKDRKQREDMGKNDVAVAMAMVVGSIVGVAVATASPTFDTLI